MTTIATTTHTTAANDTVTYTFSLRRVSQHCGAWEISVRDQLGNGGVQLVEQTARKAIEVYAARLNPEFAADVIPQLREAWRAA